MKVIFLDFDGVICTSESISEARAWFNNKELYNIKMIDPLLVENLNKVIEKTDAKVVISSDWRYFHSMGELRKFLRVTGFSGKVIDRTPIWKEYKNDIGIKTCNGLKRFWEHERGNEIKMWLDKHEVKTYVIIDDEISDIFSIFPDNYIRTDMENGFHKGLIKVAINKLNEEI